MYKQSLTILYGAFWFVPLAENNYGTHATSIASDAQICALNASIHCLDAAITKWDGEISASTSMDVQIT